MRLDVFLASQAYARSRSRAANLIKMGFVLVNGEKVTKTSVEVTLDDTIEVTHGEFASLGSFKIQRAFEEFSLNVKDSVCVDIGAANGGFSEVLLAFGAKKIFAVDVGDIDFPEYLLSDKIVLKPNLNARYITPADIGEQADFAVIDVSFIPLKLVLAPIMRLLKKGGTAVALIKPQFEAKKSLLNKNGIIKNPKTVDTIVKEVADFCAVSGFEVLGLTPVPEYFSDKNKEFLIHIRYN